MGSYNHILSKMNTNIGILQIISQFEHFDNTKWPQNTFRTKHDGISSTLIDTQYGVTLYMVTPGGQIPEF